MKKQTIKELLNKRKDGSITPEELTVLESWYIHQAKLNPSLKDNDEFTAALNELDEEFPFFNKDI